MWKDDKLVQQVEKLKSHPGHFDINYSEFNSGMFEKYLEAKAKQQIDIKSNQIKSKYFTLEFAKKLKSKNIIRFLDVH